MDGARRDFREVIWVRKVPPREAILRFEVFFLWQSSKSTTENPFGEEDLSRSSVEDLRRLILLFLLLLETLITVLKRKHPDQERRSSKSMMCWDLSPICLGLPPFPPFGRRNIDRPSFLRVEEGPGWMWSSSVIWWQIPIFPRPSRFHNLRFPLPQHWKFYSEWK